jgi:hypothetical protein
MDTSTADPPMPNGPTAPLPIRPFPAAWQAADLMAAVTRYGGARFSTVQETGAGSGGGVLTSADWIDPSSKLKLGVSIDKRPDGVIDIIQCYANGADLNAAVPLFQLCADNAITRTTLGPADAWVSTQARLLQSSPAETVLGKTYTSPQPVFGATRVVLREHLLAAGSPVMDMLLTSAS